jgi:hypothetical protein
VIACSVTRALIGLLKSVYAFTKAITICKGAKCDRTVYEPDFSRELVIRVAFREGGM